MRDRRRGHRVPKEPHPVLGDETRRLQSPRLVSVNARPGLATAMQAPGFHPVCCFLVVSKHPLCLRGSPIPGGALSTQEATMWSSLREDLTIVPNLIPCKAESVQTLLEGHSCFEPRIPFFPNRITPRTSPSECILPRTSSENPHASDAPRLHQLTRESSVP